MEKFTTLKRVGILLAVSSATGARSAHAGDYGPPVAHNVTGQDVAYADLIGDGHTIRVAGGPTTNYTQTDQKTFPVNEATTEYTFSYAADGPDDHAGPRRFERKVRCEGGPLEGSHIGSVSRAQGWANLAPSNNALHVDTLNANPDRSAITQANQTIDMGTIYPADGANRIIVTVSVSGSGYSDLKAGTAAGSQAKTDFKGLKISNLGVTIPPKPIIVGPPRGRE